MQARLGYSNVAMLACRVGDRDGGEQASGGTERSRDEHRGPESRGKGVRVQVGGAGDAGQGGQYGDGQQAAEARANHAVPITYTFRLPKRSRSDPPISRNAASVSV